MHTHRVEVLDRADDDDVVGAVADHLELELVPALDRLLDEDLPDRGLGQAALDLACESRAGSSAKPPPWPPSVNAGRTTAGSETSLELVERRDDARRRAPQSAAPNGVTELLAILGAPDHVDGSADELDAELLEDAAVARARLARLSAV